MPDMETRAVLGATIDFLRDTLPAAARKKAATGFDGCCDSIMNVFQAAGMESAGYFPDMRSFGEHIIQKHGMSCSVELDERSSRIGGNAPIFAHALGTLGVRTDLFGTLGQPDVHPVFRDLCANVAKYSFAPNNIAMALEFSDGKVMLAPRHRVDNAWDALEACAPGTTVRDSFLAADLIMLNNWSELDYSQALWEGVCDRILRTSPVGAGRFVMADLADCSRHEAPRLFDVCALLGRFSQHRTTVLGLNENEARVLYAAVKGKQFHGRIRDLAAALLPLCGASEIVVHANTIAVALSESGEVALSTLHIVAPRIVTGGGDHFNAGYALGLLLGAEQSIRLALGNAVSSCYISTGEPPDGEALTIYLKSWL